MWYMTLSSELKLPFQKRSGGSEDKQKSHAQKYSFLDNSTGLVSSHIKSTKQPLGKETDSRTSERILEPDEGLQAAQQSPELCLDEWDFQ